MPTKTLLRPSINNMEVAMEVVVDDDDVFFADLNKQISLLIMDDDEHEIRPTMPSPAISLQAFARVHSTAQAPILYQQIRCARESKGTGVFIPRSSQPRRKSRQRRPPCNTKFYRQQANSRVVSRV